MTAEVTTRAEEEKDDPRQRDGAPPASAWPRPELERRETEERHAATRRAARRRESGTAESDARVAAHTSALREGLAVFRALADNVRDYAIFLTDPDGVITYWGEGARLMKWWTPDEAEGAHLRLLYPDGGSDDGTAEDHLRQAAAHGEYTGEGRRVRNDDSTFWANVALTALRDPEGRLLGFAKVTRDLTARRAADALLLAATEAAEQARAAAEAANAAKSDFLATMSHEIRTPINAVLGYLDLLEMEVSGPLVHQQREFIGRARLSGRHLLGLIDDVLDLSRLEAKRVSIERARGRLADVVNEAVALVVPGAATRDITLTNAASFHADGVGYWGDSERVRQVVVNLLSNAVKFTAAGGRITVSAGIAEGPPPSAGLAGGPWAYVRVEDTGEGIPADRLNAVFEPFVQADMSRTRQHGGTGLGLSISRHLARLMGGAITVRSEVGVGSTFFLWLPAALIPSKRSDATGPGGVDTDQSAAEADRGDGGGPTGSEAGDAMYLRGVADAVLERLEAIVRSYVERLRADPEVPGARRVDPADVEDHLASFIADIAQSLGTIDVPADEPTAAMRDSSAIQRVIAQRHGRQRARLGWSTDELRREYDILYEELAATIRRARLPAPDETVRRLEAERALVTVEKLVEVARQAALSSFEAARYS